MFSYIKILMLSLLVVSAEAKVNELLNPTKIIFDITPEDDTVIALQDAKLLLVPKEIVLVSTNGQCNNTEMSIQHGNNCYELRCPTGFVSDKSGLLCENKSELCTNESNNCDDGELNEDTLMCEKDAQPCSYKYNGDGFCLVPLVYEPNSTSDYDKQLELLKRYNDHLQNSYIDKTDKICTGIEFNGVCYNSNSTNPTKNYTEVGFVNSGGCSPHHHYNSKFNVCIANEYYWRTIKYNGFMFDNILYQISVGNPSYTWWSSSSVEIAIEQYRRIPRVNNTKFYFLFWNYYQTLPILDDAVIMRPSQTCPSDAFLKDGKCYKEDGYSTSCDSGYTYISSTKKCYKPQIKECPSLYRENSDHECERTLYCVDNSEHFELWNGEYKCVKRVEQPIVCAPGLVYNNRIEKCIKRSNYTCEKP